MSYTTTIILIVTRIVFLFLTAASFLPQLFKLRTRGSSKGISLSYIFVQFASAGVQAWTLTFGLILYFTRSDKTDRRLERIFLARYILDLTQVWLLFGLTTFYLVLALKYPPNNHERKGSILFMSTAFIILTIPMLCLAGTPSWGAWLGMDGWDLLLVYLLFLLLYLTTNIALCLGILATYVVQVECLNNLRLAGEEGMPLSLRTLGSQAVVFLLLGADWLARTGLVMDASHGAPTVFIVALWWMAQGCFVVNNILFALVQGGLFVFVRRRRGSTERVDTGRERTEDSDAERQPLLRNGDRSSQLRQE